MPFCGLQMAVSTRKRPLPSLRCLMIWKYPKTLGFGMKKYVVLSQRDPGLGEAMTWV